MDSSLSVENAAASRAASAPPPRPVPVPVPEPEEAVADAAAWAEVLAGWSDEARHRAYLARFHDLDGLATAGRRYRDFLAARPGDPIAARFRDEVLRRAVAHGLASLPREAPEHPRGKLAVRVAAGVVIGGLLLAAVVMVARLVPFLSGAHP
jgi:hypothetical protein